MSERTKYVEISVTRDPRARMLITKYYAQGCRVCDIARAMQANPNTILSILRRNNANKRLKEYSVNMSQKLAKEIEALEPLDSLFEIKQVNGKYVVYCVLDGKTHGIVDDIGLAKRILNALQERRGRKSQKPKSAEESVEKDKNKTDKQNNSFNAVEIQLVD